MSPNVAKLTQQHPNKLLRLRKKKAAKIMFEVIEDDLNLSLVFFFVHCLLLNFVAVH